MKPLLRFEGDGRSFYFEIVQILSYKNNLFWLQKRSEDSFGINTIGHFIVDKNGRECPAKANLRSFEFACEQLIAQSKK